MQVTECALEQLEPILYKNIGASMGNDEQVIACLVARDPLLVNVYLITTTRLIRAMSGRDLFARQLDSPNMESLFLTEISSFELVQKELLVHSLGKARIWCGFDTAQRAQAFASTLQSARDRLKAGSSQPKGSADRLRELAKLHSEGLVSESEFQQKRQEILKQL